MRKVMAGIVVAAALLLVGCTAATPAASPSSTPLKPLVIRGSAAVHRTVTPPLGSASARVELTCTGTTIGLTFGGDMQDRGTSCDAPRTFTMPAGGDLDVELQPAPGTEFTATFTFSRRPFHADAILARQCSLASTAESDLASATNGLETGQIDASAAQALMRQALLTIASGPFDGKAGAELSTLRTWLDANPQGDPGHAPYSSRLSQLCADNTSPLVIMSAYGG